MSVSTVQAIAEGVGTLNLQGEILDLQGNSEVEVFFDYGLDSNYGKQTSKEIVDTTGVFEIPATLLNNKTVYHFRAVMTDGTSAWYGDDLTGKTNNACGLSEDEVSTVMNEWLNDPLGHGFSSMTKRDFWRILVTPGTASVSEKIVPNGEVICTKADILKILSNASVASFRNWIDSKVDDDSVATKEIWEAYINIDIAHTRVRQMIQAMGSNGFGHWTDAEVRKVLALGERLKSRSYELFGRDLTWAEMQCEIE